MKPCDFGHMVFTWVFCSRAKARSRKQMVAPESKKIAVRLEAQRMNASNIYTKTDGKETLRPPDLKQTAEAVGRNSRLGVEGKHMFGNGRK